jgi:hypothetical protein
MTRQEALAVSAALLDLPAAPKGNGRSSGYERTTNDWYVEPAWAVTALLDKEIFWQSAHDPACGSGTIPKTCAVHHQRVACTGADIVGRGYGDVQDFLTDDTPRSNIITNPPFALATAFALHGLRVVRRGGKIAILQQLAWLEGTKRGRELFDQEQLARVWVFRRRVSMPPGGTTIAAKGGSKAFAWFVFEVGHEGPWKGGWV